MNPYSLPADVTLQILFLNIIGMLAAGILGLWWKLHKIGMTWGEFRRAITPPFVCHPVNKHWEAPQLDPSSYRDDTGREAQP